jgi:hypothetical protein
MGFPLSLISPLVGISVAVRSFIKVVFPAPLGPSKPIILGLSIEILIFCNAFFPDG